MTAPANTVTIDRPTSASGDVFIAAIAMGSTGAAQNPVFIAPTGWTLIRRLDHGNDTALGVYWHTATDAEPATYTWQLSTTIEGVAWISCYANVDPISPIEVELGDVQSTTGPSYTAASITTTTANAMVVATFASHAGATTTWAPQAGEIQRANLNNTSTRSGTSDDQLVPSAGTTESLAATASAPQDYALVHVLALQPAP